MHLIFDITLTVARPWLDQPTGIDRIELAHARHWRGLPERDVTFVMRNAWGQLAALPDGLARTLLEDADNLIARGMSEQRFRLRARSATIMFLQFWGAGRRRLLQRIKERPDSVLLTVSYPTILLQRELAYLRTLGCRFVAHIDDLIPILYPQYAPDGEQEIHRRKILSLARFGDAGLVNSRGVLDDIEAYAAEARLSMPPLKVVYPGIDLPPPRSHSSGAPNAPGNTDPYFLMLGTLDPRKNYLLMLQLWQQLAALKDAPRLIIVGRDPSSQPLSARVLERIVGRKQIQPHLAILTLERVDFRGRVEYCGRLNDHETAALLKGARALLFPSLAEGFGIPLSEALAAGVPAIVSDIAAFREQGGDVPEYIDPLDGPGWKTAILQYAKTDSPQRAAQMERLRHWQPHGWQAHFSTVQSVLETVAHAPPRTSAT
ncbi:MAG: glycosyltransferase family 4 protein [Betaproteobacteria bacterium]|nr:glycosyltransferase family 4 protein [Betaproteobacteria bacterium]